MCGSSWGTQEPARYIAATARFGERRFTEPFERGEYEASLMTDVAGSNSALRMVWENFLTSRATKSWALWCDGASIRNS
jgi:hypothetical protein